MTVCGVVAEYNPFHNGHLLHLRRAKEGADFAVVVMSGDYVQRGEAAICDKYARARMALTHGADLVLELPAAYALSAAPYFAEAAVRALSAAGVVSQICFGAETDDLAALTRAAEAIGRARPRQTGKSLPAALDAALSAENPEAAAILRAPNNLLAVEYLRALSRIRGDIRPVAVPREAAAHNDAAIAGPIASASAIRAALRQNDASAFSAMPPAAAAILRPARTDMAAEAAADLAYGTLLRYIAATSGLAALSAAAGVSEGLDRRILAATRENASFSAIAAQTKTKRYTAAHVRRTLLNIILTINRQHFNYFYQNGAIKFLRVLGFRQDAQILVSELARRAAVPVLLNLKKDRQQLEPAWQTLLDIDLRASRLYQTIHLPRVTHEYAQPLVIIP